MLVDNVWIAIALAVMSYAVGYYLALYEAHLYYTGAKNYISLEGFGELAPALEEAASRGLHVTTRFLVEVVVLTLAVFALWTVCFQEIKRPDLFYFLIGGLVLLEAAVSMRYLRNVVIFRYAREGEGIRGKIEYSRRLVHTLSFLELYGFAALYVLMFMVSGGWFFLGGALACFVSGRRRRDWTMVYA
jgi:hypothetical protein